MMPISYHNIKPYYVVRPNDVPVIWNQPRTKQPDQGFYGTITKSRDIDIPNGVKSQQFSLTKVERRDLKLETLQFKAQDEKGILEIQSVRLVAQNFLVEFKRYTVGKGQLRGEGVYLPHYNY